MNIRKRNGVVVEFNPNKIYTRIKKQAVGLRVDVDNLFQKVIGGIADDMTTSEVDDLLAQTAASMTQLHPDYSKLAGNVCISRHHKETNEDLIKTFKELYFAGVLKEEILDKAKEYKSEIYKVMVSEDDYSFDYFAWVKLREMYLLKIDDRIVERPQHMYMRIALNLTDTVEECIKYFTYLKNQQISPSTPIILNSGTMNGSLISCNLQSNKDDSRLGLLHTLENVCTASANAEGIGLSLHNVRSKESYVGKRGGKAGGLLKWMKILNESLRFFDQNGQRPGSCAVYIEPWHKDIEDFLEIRKKTGDETMRARDMFSSLWIPDNFMRAVENKTDWHLFCPNDILKAGLRPLQDLHGAEYETEYNRAVELGIGKKVNAQEIWLKLLESQIETGMPYMCFKDNANAKSNHQHLGAISMSNLCAEIFLYTNPDITAQCVLTSLPLQKFVKVQQLLVPAALSYADAPSKSVSYDHEALGEAVRSVVRALNKVIDINAYTSEEAARGGRTQRALAIGVQGLADVFAMFDVAFTSETAKKLNKEIFETIYYYAMSESNELAKKLGQTVEVFEGSNFSKGIFQFDMWGLKDEDLSGKYDWKALKKSVKKYGVMNSMLTALPPTASSASIIGSNEAFEPFNNNIYVRAVKGGAVTIVNKYLIEDLEAMELWTPEIRQKVIINNGSVQNVSEIPEHIREKYKTSYELSQKELLNMSADRAPFIDQSQSFNIFMSNATVGKLTSSHFHAWRVGLKTGQYYLRTKAIEMVAKHLANDTSAEKKETMPEKPANSMFDCFGCSS